MSGFYGAMLEAMTSALRGQGYMTDDFVVTDYEEEKEQDSYCGYNTCYYEGDYIITYTVWSEEKQEQKYIEVRGMSLADVMRSL